MPGQNTVPDGHKSAASLSISRPNGSSNPGLAMTSPGDGLPPPSDLPVSRADGQRDLDCRLQLRSGWLGLNQWKNHMCLSDVQRQDLCGITNFAFLEIRQLTENGKLDQAFDLAAVFHQLLKDIWGDKFSLVDFREEFLIGYQCKYADRAARNYVAMIDRIIQMEMTNDPQDAPSDHIAKPAPATESVGGSTQK
jgi:hypothetical protein